MRQTGRLSHWNDDRGFGFIAGADGVRYFVHISSVGRIAARPRDGDPVTFRPASGRDGRPEARSVEIGGANPLLLRTVRGAEEPDTRLRFGWRFIAAGLVVALLAIAIARGAVPVWLVVPYLVMGLASYWLYRIDKLAAGEGQWRVSEARLLTSDLVFGIVGGLLGQQIFRHKTRKTPFIIATIVVLVAHLAWLGGVASGLITAEELGILGSGWMLNTA